MCFHSISALMNAVQTETFSKIQISLSLTKEDKKKKQNRI